MLTVEIRIILAALATYRLAQLVAVDDLPFALGLRFRTWLEELAEEKKIGSWQWTIKELLTCPFCIGMWLSIFISMAVLFPTKPGDYFLVIFSIAGIQAFLESKSQGG